jgi:hypothetical protein
MNYLKTYEQNSGNSIKDTIETNLINFTDNDWKLSVISPQQLNNFSWTCEMEKHSNINDFMVLKDDIIECMRRFGFEYISFSFSVNRQPIFDIYQIDIDPGYRYVEYVAPHEIHKSTFIKDKSTIVYGKISIIIEI